MRGGASSGFIFVTACAFGACAIDLSGLQRPDAGVNPATDPGGATAGGGGGDAAGVSGTTAAGSGAAGSAGKASAGLAGAAGRGGTSGTGAAGTTSTGGQPSLSTAGMSAPPPAAGAPAAGTPAPEPTGLPPRTCGLPGLACCNPGNTCDVGACLRGKCTPYGGFYALTAACTVNPCGSRNAYTAGCDCPMGFVNTLLWQENGACDQGGTGTTEVRSCTAGRTPGIAFGGAWVQGPDDSCIVGCRTANPITGTCSCPTGAEQVSMTVDIVYPSCPSAGTTLQVCIDGGGMPVNFGGAYAVSQTAALGCGAANPLTAACSCPDGVTLPQSLHVGSWSIFVCNL